MLDDEIGRWETRGRDDPEARAVLRAFLGVREILWEFGLRPSRAERRESGPPEPPRHEPSAPAATNAADETPSDALRARRAARRAPPARIERVPVKG